ncbi:MAG: DEAD/DEAH box helicase family protein [bacterium]|nr:DEAD/DEAH box helicase family protein [bacterium]
MDEKDQLIERLRQQVNKYERRVHYLENLLKEADVSYKVTEVIDSDQPILIEENQGDRIIQEIITKNHARFFYTMFKGRTDVYSKRAGKANNKTGKTGYYTQCWNFWKDGICPKRTGKQVKCGECSKQRYKKLTGEDILNHLIGAKNDCSDVIGLYPMLEDETCNFLVFDFDNHDAVANSKDTVNQDNEWVDEVNAMRLICKEHEVPILVERSRSGKGAHIWMFFEEPVKAYVARKFGAALLTKGAESVNQKGFHSYDRMVPTQDTRPLGGLGNLVALPLQGQALKNGNSAFIDENWNAYPDQWKILKDTKKISKAFIEERSKEWTKDGLLGILADDMSRCKEEYQKETCKPWEQKSPRLELSDVDGVLSITMSNQIYIGIENVKPRMQNQIRRLAAFSNPEYYKTQAMGFSTRGIPRIIACSQEYDKFIGIPRGCKEKLKELLKSSDILCHEKDERQAGKCIAVSFRGELYPEQKRAALKMLESDIGILGAATAFGKTAVGAYLVAERKVNTLVLVHNSEIMKNWVEDFEKFLEIREELPEYLTPKGRLKKRKSVIGRLYGGHNSITGILDIAMISSLGKKGEINQIVKNYGMVIMDECHHGASQTAEDVLNEVSAKYVYGLTATPKRDDGQEQKIFMQFGPIRYRYTAKDRAKEQGVEHFVYPRFTRLVNVNGEQLGINEAYREVIASEVRNNQIITDVEECISKGRTPLVLTRFKEHAGILYEQLKTKSDHIFLLQGGRSSKEKELIRENMKEVPSSETIILVAIGQYIGEGFNYPRLDTMMLATPIAWQGNVEQYAGRLHRDYEGKQDVVIYDYVDTHIRVLEKMYHKRLRAYKKIGYELCMNLVEKKQKANAIFDLESYREVYKKDLSEANQEIVISSPGINQTKVKGIIKQLKERQEAGVKINVITLQPESYPESRIEKTRHLVDELINAGIKVKLMPRMHEHYAIIDSEIVWYGSMNLLSSEKEEDNLMRVVSKEVALELLEITLKPIRLNIEGNKKIKNGK